MEMMTVTERKKRFRGFTQRDLAALIGRVDQLQAELLAIQTLMQGPTKVPGVIFDGAGKAERGMILVEEFSIALEGAVKTVLRRKQ